MLGSGRPRSTLAGLDWPDRLYWAPCQQHSGSSGSCPHIDHGAWLGEAWLGTRLKVSCEVENMIVAQGEHAQSLGLVVRLSLWSGNGLNHVMNEQW